MAGGACRWCAICLERFQAVARRFCRCGCCVVLTRLGCVGPSLRPRTRPSGCCARRWISRGCSPYPSTIHRLLRLKLKRQGDVELCEPTEQTAMALEHLGLVLDEASMLDSTLLGVALQCAHPFGPGLSLSVIPLSCRPSVNLRALSSEMFLQQHLEGSGASSRPVAAGQLLARWRSALSVATVAPPIRMTWVV